MPSHLASARQSRRSASDWVCEAKQRPTLVRGNDESPPLEQPKSSLSDEDYVVIVEEVKSTIQARYTMTYIVIQYVCVEQTYDAIRVGMSHNDVGSE